MKRKSCGSDVSPGREDISVKRLLHPDGRPKSRVTYTHACESESDLPQKYDPFLEKRVIRRTISPTSKRLLPKNSSLGKRFVRKAYPNRKSQPYGKFPPVYPVHKLQSKSAAFRIELCEARRVSARTLNAHKIRSERQALAQRIRDQEAEALRVAKLKAEEAMDFDEMDWEWENPLKPGYDLDEHVEWEKLMDAWNIQPLDRMVWLLDAMYAATQAQNLVVVTPDSPNGRPIHGLKASKYATKW